MKRKSIFMFIAFSLAMLVVPSGRFIYGFVLVLELNLAILFGTLADFLVKKLQLDKLRNIIIIFIEIAFTILFRQIFILLYPEIMLVLGFIIYLIPISFFTMYYLIAENTKPLKESITVNLKNSISYSVFTLIFYLFRDIAGYGTFTFFGKNHQIFEKVLIKYEVFRVMTIFASIPGALFLSGVVSMIFILIYNRIEIVRRKEAKS